MRRRVQLARAKRYGALPSIVALLVSLFFTASAHAQEPPSDPAQFHIFVLAGQSNMAGRGDVAPQDSIVHPRVWTLNEDLEWVPARDPIHFDKPVAGVGPGRSFGIAIAEADPTVHIGLVPTAVGGSAISSWVPGGIHQETGAHPWDDAVVRTRAALARGTLRGILWHQGESDSSPRQAEVYDENLIALIARFRETFSSSEAPFLIGQLGRWAGPWSAGRVQVDAVHQMLPTIVPRVAFVSAAGLADKGDDLHFDALSARELGRRYADAYLTMAGGN